MPERTARRNLADAAARPLDRAMIEDVADLSPEALAGFDAIIDVRSPAEFAEDRIPGAINLPVLSNEERADVGTIYLRHSRFLARRIGAAYVARNVAAHLDIALADRDAKFRPLLYCWRGGMRSNAMATILTQIGWRVGVLKGGYRTWRRAVVAALADDSAPINFVLIDGETGTAKTEILRRLSARGVQAIDLEGLAAHKGSVFGAEAAREQPTQKLFESELFDRLRAIDPARPIAVEAESSRIGRLILPKRIWSAMRAAPRVIIEAPIEARADYLSRAYSDFINTPGAVGQSIDRLRPFHSKETIEDWLTLAEEGRHKDLAVALMRDHYDPLYARSRKRAAGGPAAVLRTPDLAEESLDNVAGDVAAAIMRLSRRSPP
jgi:tRNA 2-selenouridine synthase